jgi:hypothetical protein
MMNFILKHIESIPAASFTERELNSVSQPAYERLKKLKCLTMVKYDYLKEQYFGAGSGDEHFIKKQNGCYYAYSVESPDALPVNVDEKDLRRFQLSFPALFEKIRTANRIEGAFQEINEGNYYIGYKLYDKFRVGFIFIPKIGKDKLVKFAGLKDICKDDKILVVFTPFTKIEDIVLKWTLSKCKIVTAPLASVLDLDTFKLPIDEIIKEFSDEIGKTTELTKKQAKDYKSYGYKCYDNIHIPGTAPMKRSNNLIVNGHTIKMPDGAFRLLIELVVELKKGKGGWLAKVVDAGKYQIFDRVRSPIQGSLMEKDAKKFIENNASKQYRISTHPGFVTCDRKSLLKHSDSIVRTLAKQIK